MANDPRVLLVGWDAADWKIVQTLVDQGLMPATKRLIENGVMGNIMTLSPVLSPMLWTSIATGKRPYNHGILGFAEPTSDGHGIQPVTNLSRKTKAIWNILCQNQKRCNVVGWWPSSPAEPIDGVMVSNHYQRAPGPIENGWPVLPGTIHPPRLIKTLAELRLHPSELEEEHHRPFLPHGDQIDQVNDRRFEGVLKNLADCTTIQNCATYLMENEPWDFMAVYFDAIDHFSHGYMKYHPPKLDWVNQDDYEMYKNVVTTGYVYHDMMLARLLDLAGDDVTVILLSDHGFHPDHLRRPELPLEPAGPAAEHREHGIFVMHGPGIKQDELVHGVSLLDITPTILTLFDLPIGQDMDGRVITSAFQHEPLVETIPSWDLVDGKSGQHPSDRLLDQKESEDAINQLIELGYIERPSDDRDKAVREISQELEYNLARSYMDGGLHGEAVPILVNLYLESPLEFRFGIQLAICLQAIGHVDDLERLVGDIKQRWGRATYAARERLAEINQIALERKSQLQKTNPENGLNDREQIDLISNPQKDVVDRIFNEKERSVIKKIRGLCKGNPKTLDYLAGWASMSKGDNENALKHFKHASHSKANVPGFHFHLAETYRAIGDYEEAVSNYDQVLEMDPHNAGAHLGLARTHLNKNENRKALASAQTALGLKYDLAPAHYCVGICKMRAADFTGAIRALETAIETNPNFSEAYLKLASIHEDALHQPQKADEYRKLAKELDKQNLDQTQNSFLPELPPIDGIDFDDLLPTFHAEKRSIIPSLSKNPIKRPDESDNSQSGDLDRCKSIIVVSGLPRSGTSMLMQMLVNGGIEPLTDGIRIPDENNPRGYFELEQTKRLADENDWLGEAAGRVIKVVSPLIPYLPQGFSYKVLVMKRDLSETISSQTAMLNRLGREKADLDDSKLKSFLASQYDNAIQLLRRHSIPYSEIAYTTVLDEPEKASKAIQDFLGVELILDEMAKAVDRNLHRERTAS